MMYDNVTEKMLIIAKNGFGRETIEKVFDMGTFAGRTIYLCFDGVVKGRTGLLLAFYLNDDGSMHKLNFDEYTYISQFLH